MNRINRLSAFMRALVLAVVLASPAIAQPMVPAGFDLWTTTSDGKTLVDFSKFPIPPGFFSEDSEAFTGVVRFQGEPLVTDPPRLLGNVDTIVERLTDALPDGTPIPIRMRALRLRSIKPITVHSGGGVSRWDLEAYLIDEQPQTEMRFFADSRHGGHWDAEIGLNARISFVNTRTNEKLTADHSISLQTRGARWQYFPLRSTENFDPGALTQCAVGVDVDIDGAVDSTIDGWCASSVFIPVSTNARKPLTVQAAGYRGAAESSSYVYALARNSNPAGYVPAQNVGPPGFIIITISVPVHENVTDGLYHQVEVWIPKDAASLAPEDCPLFEPCNDNDPCTKFDRCIPDPRHQGRMICIGYREVSVKCP